MAKTPKKQQAVEDASKDMIFREIDEELRQDRAKAFWDQYGNTIIGACLALVLGVAGFEGWKYYDTSQRASYGERFQAAIIQSNAGNAESAIQELSALATEAGAGYGALARMKEASIHLRENRRSDAAVIYFEVSADTDADPILRDVSTLLGVMASLDTGNVDDLLSRLAPLSADGGTWRFTARELTAHLQLKAGDTAGALAMFGELSEDAAAPQGLRNRALEMKAALEG